MKNRSFAIVLLLIGVLASLSNRSALGDEPSQPQAIDNPELTELFEGDQADRRPPEGEAIDWAVVVQQDRAREVRVKKLYTEGSLNTARDYYHAALVLMHSNDPESHLLAHELSIVSAIKGESKARWLVAASEDRFLMNIGRPQRFATQYRSLSPDTPMTLHEVEEGVTDKLRTELNVPSLEEARGRERAMSAATAVPCVEPAIRGYFVLDAGGGVAMRQGCQGESHVVELFDPRSPQEPPYERLVIPPQPPGYYVSLVGCMSRDLPSREQLGIPSRGPSSEPCAPNCLSVAPLPAIVAVAPEDEGEARSAWVVDVQGRRFTPTSNVSCGPTLSAKPPE